MSLLAAMAIAAFLPSIENGKVLPYPPPQRQRGVSLYSQTCLVYTALHGRELRHDQLG